MYIKRQLTSELELFKDLHLRRFVKKRPTMRHRVTVGIGGNVGDTRRRFVRLYSFMGKSSLVELEKISAVLKNPPFGFLKQDFFFNAVVVLRTNLQPRDMLAYLMRVEKKFARKRSFANAPRTLDLDIVFFDNKKINSTDLVIPHPAWFKRESVMIPLREIYR